MKRSTVLALVIAPLAATAAFAASPQSFLRQAGMNDNSEIELGGLAQSKAGSADVRDFGRMLQRDHNMSKRQAMPIARHNHVTPPAGLLPEARMEERQLRRLNGRAFDREFARFAVTSHRKAIALFEQQARNGDRETAAFARAQLPTLREHLRMAQRLAR